MKKVLTAVSLLAIALSASADPTATDANLGAHFVLTGGLTYGGDKIATIDYEDGDDANIRAGSLFLLGLGGDYRFSPNWELQLTVNYQFDQANAENGDASFHRLPVDLLGFYRQGSHRFGGGVTYHINPEFEADFDDIDGDFDVDFDNALGLVVEYDYFFTDSVSLGVRYTSIEYEASDFNAEVDGSYFGLLLNGYF